MEEVIYMNRKRTLSISFIVMFILILLTLATTLPTRLLSTKLSPTEEKLPDPPPHSLEELYRDLFITLMDAPITEAIKDTYGQSYSYMLSSVDFLKIERPHGYRSFYFIVTLQVMPYTGPHNTVGLDNYTFSVEAGSKVKLLNSEHLESYSH